MGGEVLIPLALIGGVIGLLAAAVIAWRSPANGWKRLVIVFGVFVLGLIAPTAALFGFGTYVKMTQPQIQLPAPK